MKHAALWSACALVLCAPGLPAARAEDGLAKGFAEPPADTRPWCYWYWISDNLAKEGITRDLEAMARVGIGEALIGNVVDPDTPLGGVALMSEQWFDCMAHAVVEGKRLGVNIGVFNGPGWSQSGGPWVAAAQAMRYVVTSETRVRGPVKFEGKLPAPQEVFQDIAVLAFPAPREDGAAVRPSSIRCATEAGAPEKLADGDPATGCAFPVAAAKAGGSLVVDIAFDAPFTARSLTLHPLGGSFSAKCALFAADDAGAFRPVREFMLDRRGLSRPKYAVNVGPMIRGPAVAAFAATTARAFRLQVTLLAVEGAGAVTGSAASVSEMPGLAEVVLSGAARMDAVVEKQLGKMHPTPLPDWGSYLWPRPQEPESPDLAVTRDRIVNLSDRLDAAGVLRWDAPAGEWIVLRAGMVPTGAKNHPTTDQGCGYECDKMSRAAIKAHFNGFLAPLLKRVPDAARAALTRVVIDSYEVGSENWTDGFHESFHGAFGYDPRPWLPVLTGRIVGTADASERFLWDLRRHVADRTATEYVGGLRELSNRRGLRLWLENYGHWGFPGEFLQYGGQSDDLGGEFWVREGSPVSQAGIELRAASSAAHVYGKRLVFSEAFTSARSFRDSPASIKSLGDWAFSHGINQLVLHVCIHQPWEDRRPGVNAWFGTEFNRHNTWFGESKAWIDYLRRCHFLLRQGRDVADVAYFIGEDAPKMTGTRQPALPAGYDYDYINAEALLRFSRVERGRITLESGASYALLVLPPQETMRPDLLRRIRDLVAEGAAVLGPPPLRSPSLQNHPACDDEVAALAKDLWGDLAAHKDPGLAQRAFGKGRVFRGDDLAAVLRELKTGPAIVCPDGVVWTHRRDRDADIYFLSNQKDAPVLADVSFRVEGRVPELWRADTGAREATAWFEPASGRTRVPVALDPHGSVFVVFRQPSDASPVVRVLKDGSPVAAPCPARAFFDKDGALRLAATQPGRYALVRADGRQAGVDVAVPPPVEIAGPWRVTFPTAPGAPAPLDLPRLISWPEHPDDAVKHFSGTATCRAAFRATPEMLKAGRRVILDLGGVQVIARLRLNGRDLGVLWKKPFAADVTGIVQAGENTIEIEVTNTWWNRLVGDEKLAKERRATFTTAPPRAPRTALLPAGLLGPVTLRMETLETAAFPPVE